MIPSLILALREGIEAALIIGIVLGVLRKMDRQDLKSSVWKGVLSALGVSLLAAITLNWIGTEFEGRGEQLFEGSTMLLAAGIMTWMVFWLQNQTGTMKKQIESGVHQATLESGQKALFFLTFLAVVREGIELALFLLAAGLATNPFQEFLGAILGLGLAALLGLIIFRTSHRLSISRFFQITNVLLALFAAGLVGLGVHEFNELGWIPAIQDHIWNINNLMPENSILGQFLKALVGYSSSPSLSQVIAYLGYFCLLGIVVWVKRYPLPLRNRIGKNGK